MDTAKFSFPAVRGIQANMEYYVTMVPLDCIPKLFTFKDENLAPDIRSQRTLNKARIPEMCNYILSNPTSYVFSALTASIDGEVFFEPSERNADLGILNISMCAKMLINDGQHRRAAIEAALKKNPDLKFEHISIVLYHDIGLKRSQQMFSDLNRLIDKEHTSIPNRSIALFTLSALHHGTIELLKNIDASDKQKLQLATEFWKNIYLNMPEWNSVAKGEVKSSVIRRDSLSPLSITLRALGQVGNEMLLHNVAKWTEKLRHVKIIDWQKSNDLWHNGIVINGSVQLSHATQAQMTQILKELIIR